MIRFWLCIVIIALCGYFGRLKSKKVQLRLQCMMEMKEILICLQAEMKNEMIPIMESLLKVSQNVKILSFLLTACACKLKECPAKSFGEIWDEETLSLAKEDAALSVLNPEELALVRKTGKSLVNVSIPTQDAYFTLLFQEYGRLTEIVKSEAEKKTKLYHSLSLLAGFFLAILLI